METDITSIIIGVVAMSTFIIPIGIHELTQRNKSRKTRKTLYAAAAIHDLQIDEMEVLRNGIAIGMDTQKRCILHINKNSENVIHLKDIQSCRIFKDSFTEAADDDTKIIYQSMGIHITFNKHHGKELKLPLFAEKDGATFGGDEVSIRKWIGNIHNAAIEES